MLLRVDVCNRRTFMETGLITKRNWHLCKPHSRDICSQSFITSLIAGCFNYSLCMLIKMSLKLANHSKHSLLLICLCYYAKTWAARTWKDGILRIVLRKKMCKVASMRGKVIRKAAILAAVQIKRTRNSHLRRSVLRNIPARLHKTVWSRSLS